MANNDSSDLGGAAVALMALLCLCWGLQQVTVKVAMEGVPPLLQGGIRSAGAVALVWAWSAWRGVPLFGRDGSLGWGIAAGVLFAVEFMLIFWGLSFTTASRGVLFLYTTPFMVAVAAHFLLGERLGPWQVAGLLSAFAGVALAFGDALRLPTRRELVGDLMMLGGAALWAATTLLIKRTVLIRISPNKVLFYQLAVSAALMPLASALAGEGGVRSLDAHVAWALAYQVVVVAFASYLAWFWLVSRHPAGRLAAISFLTPLFGVMAGALLLGEPVSPWLAAAMALVCLGIYLVNRRTPPARTRSPDECTA